MPGPVQRAEIWLALEASDAVHLGVDILNVMLFVRLAACWMASSVLVLLNW